VGTIITPEQASVAQSFQRCLELRDKYVAKSLQRLGDNPRDHDGVFQGVASGFADVSGVKPDADLSSVVCTESPHQPWTIYPKPPPPHWHFTAKETIISADGHVTPDSQFIFSQCQIPGNHEWEFEIDDKGVYQVYADASGNFISSLPVELEPTLCLSRKQGATLRYTYYQGVLCRPRLCSQRHIRWPLEKYRVP
jgi:AMP deaminase